MNDQERTSDFLTMEKKLSNNYDMFASECTNMALRNEYIQALTRGHNTQTELFQTAQSHGWYQVTQAPDNQVQQAKNKYSSQMPQ